MASDRMSSWMRRAKWPVFAVLGVCVLVVAAAWLRLFVAPFHLPNGLQSRIEARIDTAMAARRVDIGDMVLALPEGGRAPALEFRDVALTDPEGEVRAVLPALRFRVAPGPLVGGQMRLRSATITGAGLNLHRDPEGRLDLNIAGGTTDAADVSLADTLSRLDAMFASPVFSRLEDVRGEDLEVVLSDDLAGRTMRLHSANMRLTRNDARLLLEIDGSLAGSRDARLALQIAREAAAGVTEITMSFDTLAARDLAAVSPAMAWLDLVRAPIDGTLSAALADDGTIGAVTGEIQLGHGRFSVPGLEAPLGFDGLNVAFGYDAHDRRALFDRIELAAPQLSFDAFGHADVSEDGSVMIGQLQLRDIVADPEGLFEAPIPVEGAAIDLRLSLGETVSVEIGQATLFDGDLRASLNGHIRAEPDGVRTAINAQMASVDVETVLAHWPETAIPNTRWWVAEHLTNATASGADFAVRAEPGATPDFELSFDFNGADIIALPAAPPILGASGYFNLMNERLIVGLDGGTVAADGQGPVALAGSRMVIEDVSVTGPEAHFDMAFDSALPDLIHIVAGPPFHLLETSGYGADAIGNGDISVEAQIVTRFVQLPPEEALANLRVTAEGVVTDFEATELVPEMRLAADRLVMTMTPEALSIGGQAALDGVPVSGQWSVLLDPNAPPGSIIEGRAIVTRDNLARFNVALPEWLISGRGTADFTARLARDTPVELDVRSDLDGIGISIPPLAWSMPANRTGDFAASIRLGPQPSVTDLRLEVGGLSLEGAVSFTSGGWLDQLTASRFRLGQWLDVSGALIGQRDGVPGISITGGILDFRTMPSLTNSAGPSGDIGRLDIALDRMQITEGIALTDLRADLDGGTISGQFRGSVNGAAPVAGQVVPSPNGPSVRIQSNDGGAVMRAAQIFDDMYGGPFDLILAARPETGQYDGRLTIDSPRLRNAPVMAELLNVISVVGLLEQLSGDGINMGEVDARFRITPQSIVLNQGTAVGPAMGISMDGVYDVASGRYEMQGVFSPLYVINGVMGALFATRREGLFGFSYRLTGAGDGAGTNVSVNPLSILTPGIFREIFRAPPPDFSDQDGGGG